MLENKKKAITTIQNGSSSCRTRASHAALPPAWRTRAPSAKAARANGRWGAYRPLADELHGVQHAERQRHHAGDSGPRYGGHVGLRVVRVHLRRHTSRSAAATPTPRTSDG